MPPIHFSFLNRHDVEELGLTDYEILDAIEGSLAAQGRGETVIEPRMHLEPGQANGHFNVLRGALNATRNSAGVKVVGDFVDNYKVGLPSELGVLLLFDPTTGAPQAIMDASGITDMRTGAVTAIGAKYLARKAGPRERRRDKPAVAPRPVIVRHRARSRDAQQGRAPGHRATSEIFMKRYF